MIVQTLHVFWKAHIVLTSFDFKATTLVHVYLFI